MSIEEQDFVKAIENITDDDFARAMDEFDKRMAREDPWAFKEFVGTWPTKKDKGLE